MTLTRSTASPSARASGEGRPRRLHLHDQWREGEGARGRASPAGTASLSQRQCATADQPIRISLFAPNGRMGKAIARRPPRIRLRDRPGSWRRSGRFLRARCASRRALTARCRQAFRSWSGPPDSARTSSSAIDDAAKRVAVLRAPNTSLGVTLLRRAGRASGRSGWAPSGTSKSLEMHHRHKVDAPSGTALLLGDRPQRRAEAANCRCSTASIGSANRTRASTARSASHRCAADRSPATMS